LKGPELIRMSKRQSETDHLESDHGTAYLRGVSIGATTIGEGEKKVVAVGVGLNYNK